jgi:hypothetical protein
MNRRRFFGQIAAAFVAVKVAPTITIADVKKAAPAIPRDYGMIVGVACNRAEREGDRVDVLFQGSGGVVTRLVEAGGPIELGDYLVADHCGRVISVRTLIGSDRVADKQPSSVFDIARVLS